MRCVRNEDGIALVTALMFTLISLGIIMALMYMIIAGTKMSGSQKRYRNSLEASYGGVALVTKEFIPRLFDNYSTGSASLSSDYGGVSLLFSTSLQKKLSDQTVNWPGTFSKTSNPKDNPDITFILSGLNAGEKFKVYSKIVDTVSGNSDTSGIDYLLAGVGVAGTGSGIAPKHTPSLFTIEIQGEQATNPKEKAQLSVLYAF